METEPPKTKPDSQGIVQPAAPKNQGPTKDEWTITHFAYGNHWVWKNNRTNQLAITDGSIRRKGDPTSTDDGLLLIDTTMPIIETKKGDIYIALINNKGDAVEAIIDSTVAEHCRKKHGMQFISKW